LHPHLHCIVPGGINRDGQWKNTSDGKFLFPVKLCQSFRAKFAKLKANHLSKSETILEKAMGCFLLKNLWNQIGGGIFGTIHP
jgi:hypothetical protein